MTFNMSIDLYKPFTNPVTKETFRCISSTPEAYTMEWTVDPGGYVPFEHVHVAQDEIFHVERGEIRALIDRKEYAGKAGDGSVWTYSLHDKKASLFADAPSWQQSSSFSPDGHWIAYLSEDGGRNVIVEPFPPTGVKFLIPRIAEPIPFGLPTARNSFS